MNITEDRTLRFDSSEQRIFQRILIQASCILRLNTGYTIRGQAKNLSFQGVFLKTDDATGNIATNDEGHFDFILHEGKKELLTRYTCAVMHVDANGVGLKFFDQEVTSSSAVFVRRSNGSFEAGWAIVAPTEATPDIVKDLINAKKQAGPCVVCTKPGKTPESSRYKVYTVQDLLAIQESARLTED